MQNKQHVTRPWLWPAGKTQLASVVVNLVVLIFILMSTLTGCTTTKKPTTFLCPVENHEFTSMAVAADHPIASLAGYEMLEHGGNAVDAAVAASFTLSVVRPYSCGIGGGGFMVIHDPATPANDDPKSVVLNYRETSPAAVGPEYYVKLDDPIASRFGVHAAGVPGTVEGLLYALETYGTLDRATVLAPAIRAAEHGFAADANFVSAVQSIQQKFVEHPQLKSQLGTIWTDVCRGGELKTGDIITNRPQANALRLIAQHGRAGFYEGEVANAIVEVMQQYGGPMTRADLSSYQLVTSQPLQGQFREFEVLAMPPPSSGGIAIMQMFTMLEDRYDTLGSLSVNNASYVHLITETMKHAFADRAEWLADAAFVDVPTDALLSPAYLEAKAWSIDLQQTLQPADYGSRRPPNDDAGTSHISVIDRDGMAVACTETINLEFGSLVEVPGFGFALNNEMDDFTTIPGQPNAFGLTQTDRNLPEPGKRPLSSMSPTIVLRDGQPMIIAGASGGPRIITGTMQAMLNSIMFGDNAGQAIARPRFHHQWQPDILRLEAGWDDGRLMEQLEYRGHEIGDVPSVGNVQMIVIEIDEDGTRIIHAASDPRKGGIPAGE